MIKIKIILILIIILIIILLMKMVKRIILEKHQKIWIII